MENIGKALGHSKRSNTRLASLNLSGNLIGDDGAERLAEVGCSCVNVGEYSGSYHKESNNITILRVVVTVILHQCSLISAGYHGLVPA